MNNNSEISFPGEEISHWIEIILPLALPTIYTYAVPPHLFKQANPGCRAEVVFGKNKNMQASLNSSSLLNPL